MKEKLIKKLCVKIPVDSEITPYISHKPIAYTLKQFEPKTEDITEGYVKSMNQVVLNKINMSKYIMDKNYYKHVWDYVK